jgi:hypothetical protein
MSILFVQHAENEGPGIFKQVLDEYAIPFHTRETLSPVSFFLPADCRGVIILGGPMNVDEESKYPFLKEEKVFIRELLSKEIPLLGICLGAQLIAQRTKKNSGGIELNSPRRVNGISFFRIFPSRMKSSSGMGIPSKSLLKGNGLSPHGGAPTRDLRLENELTAFNFIWRLMPR